MVAQAPGNVQVPPGDRPPSQRLTHTGVKGNAGGLYLKQKRGQKMKAPAIDGRYLDTGRRTRSLESQDLGSLLADEYRKRPEAVIAVVVELLEGGLMRGDKVEYWKR